MFSFPPHQSRRSTTAHVHIGTSANAQPCVGSSSPQPNSVWLGTPLTAPFAQGGLCSAVQHPLPLPLGEVPRRGGEGALSATSNRACARSHCRKQQCSTAPRVLLSPAKLRFAGDPIADSSLLRAKSRRKRRLRSVHPPAGGRQRGSQVWCGATQKKTPRGGLFLDQTHSAPRAFSISCWRRTCSRSSNISSSGRSLRWPWPSNSEQM